MIRARAVFLAALLSALPLAEAAAQSRPPMVGSGFSAQERSRGGDDDRRQPRVQAPRMDPGRMLGVSQSGVGYVVRWEYPGGRVADIMADRNGRVMGER